MAAIFVFVPSLELQNFAVQGLTTFAVFHMCAVRPFKDPNMQSIEVFNQVILMLMTDQAFLMTEAFEPEARYRQAWLYISCMIGLFAVNLFYTIWSLQLY